MLIRTQDKTGISNLDNLDCIGIEERFDLGKHYMRVIAYNGTIDSSINLAEYSTKEKAVKVLDMIQEEYCKHIFGEGGQMFTRDLYVPAFAFVPPKVFQMPQDEEVVP